MRSAQMINSVPDQSRLHPAVPLTPISHRQPLGSERPQSGLAETPLTASPLTEADLWSQTPFELRHSEVEGGSAQPPQPSVPGLAAHVNLENYLADLEDLAAQVNHYLEVEDRLELSELLPLLQKITRSVKNIAVIYTDCLTEAIDRYGATQQQVQTRLTQYPEAIAGLQRRLLRTDQQIRQLSESVAIFSAAIDRQIAFDPTLKNDAQRRARRTELLESDGDYIAASIALKEAQDRREDLLIELQLLRNQFSVLKLGMREAIALKEMASFDAA
uniref:Uncharacterized protein n=1 Tax=Cyanothece sp. (strain PCC 7425 / ATCC 29141) TaxID=395961 RepID=B8HKQ5_CYAP4